MKRKILILCGLLALALGATALVYRFRRGPEALPISAYDRSGSADVMVAGVPVFLQKDPQWAADTIGGSNEPMGSAGCTITCAAMTLNAIGLATDPQKLNGALKQSNGFTPQGHVIWSALESAMDGRVRIRFPALSHEAIETELRQNRPVIAKIMLAPTVPHWVLIVGKQGSEFLILDPLNREKKPIPLSSRSERIYAVRVIRKT